MKKKVIERFREPSSYAALAAVLALFGVNVEAEVWSTTVQVVSGLFGLAGFFMREKGGK